MTKPRIETKYLLYSFKIRKDKIYEYWYETDKKYFKANKPPQSILNQNKKELIEIKYEDIIINPWDNWKNNNIQKIITKEGICINYLLTSNQSFIQKAEDLKLLELYNDVVENFDISNIFGFDIIKEWHHNIFKTIYPFSGCLRTVEMSKGCGGEAWIWKLEFLNAIPKLDSLITKITSTKYSNIDSITIDLSMFICDFLFIHPFREGNGRISRLVCDIILAKNNFPMIGLNLKEGDNYIERVHSGYTCNYTPMEELLKIKIREIMN